VSLTPLNNLSAVSLTPVNSFLAVSLTTAKISPWQGLIAGVVDTGDKIFAGVVDIVDIAGFNNTSDKYSFAISPQIFEKIQNGPNGILGGLADTDSWKKLEVENLVSDSL
jgi:hypothetical protein